jgi:hypothetical protein
MPAPAEHFMRPSGRWLRWVLLSGFCVGALVGVQFAHAQAAAPAISLERTVKAAFLYKFLSYAEFPAAAFADASAPLVIGVVGADAIAVELSRIVAGRSAGQRPVIFKSVRESEPAVGVHLLFIPGADPQHVARLMKAAQQAPMLLVTECDNCLQHGSVINFMIIGERVRFDVSLEAAERNNIKLSSRLLTVANQVHRGAP